MEIRKTVVAGTLESSDIMITLAPGQDTIEIDLTSSVEKEFGDAIREEITKTLTDMGIESAKVTAVDKGALDCTIRARVKTAVCRADGTEAFLSKGNRI
jgi:citrate lyase subunit gamma (acyl carrier protein)